MARTLHASLGGGSPPPVVTGAFRLGDVRHVFADPSRAAAVLGFAATEPFDPAVVTRAAAPGQ
jgi:dTDP-L-rhamnose 4-epimerase